MSGRPPNEDRQTAIDLGLTTYKGKTHVRCGTNERYVAGGGCIHCARLIATEQREARKFLKQHRAEEAEQFEAFVEAASAPLDNPADDGLDAKARREASIDELM